MQHALDRFLTARSPAQIAAIGTLLVVLIGGIDVTLTYEIAMSVFYLIPVAIVAWYAPARFGAVISLFGAFVWLVADLAGGHAYELVWAPYWNAAVRLAFFVIVAQLLCRLRGALDSQKQLAQHDALTGLFNSRALKQRYEEAARLAARHGHYVTLGFLDIDDFKLVNDRFGHRVGDQVLGAVASALSDRVRGTDLVGRVGGDEFVVLLPQTAESGARIFFAQMLANLIELAEANRWPIGFSIGVAVFQPPPPSSEEAFVHADALMYEVKNAGKNGIMLREFPGQIDHGHEPSVGSSLPFSASGAPG